MMLSFRVVNGSNIAELMQCFTQKNLNNPKFRAVTRRFKELKETEGGLTTMCKLMDDIVNEEKEKQKVRIELLTNMINNGYSKKDILNIGFTEDEYKKAEEELLTTF